MMAIIYSLKCTMPFSFAVPLLSLAATHYRSLSLFVTRCTTRCHSLSLAIIRCHSLSFVVTRCTTRCTIRCHSLSLVLPLVVTRCHSLSLVVTRCTTRLSFYKQSYRFYSCQYAFIKFYRKYEMQCKCNVIIMQVIKYSTSDSVSKIEINSS